MCCFKCRVLIVTNFFGIMRNRFVFFVSHICSDYALSDILRVYVYTNSYYSVLGS